MKKRLSLCLAMLLTLALAVGAASADDVFSPMTLLKYTLKTSAERLDSVVFEWDDDGNINDSFIYYTYSFPAASQAGSESYAQDFMMIPALMAINAEDAIPAMLIFGTSEADFTPVKMVLLTNGNVYTIDFPRNISEFGESVETNGQFEYYYSASLGSAGIKMLQDLNDTRGEYSLRVFYNRTDYFEVTDTPGASTEKTDYELFFDGLIASYYLDSNGEASASTRYALERGIDRSNELNNVTTGVQDGKNWPIVTPAPTPLTNIDAAAIASYETISLGDKGPHILEIRTRMYELGYFAKVPTQEEFTRGMVEYLNAFQAQNGLEVTEVITPEAQAVLFSEHAQGKAAATARPTSAPSPSPTPYTEPAVALTLTRNGEWSRNRGVPWFKMEVRNNSKELTISRVSFVYYCEDKDGKILTDANDEQYTFATVDKTVRPGNRVMLPRVEAEGFENVGLIWASLSGYFLEDGTEVVLPEREWNFFSLDY